MAEIAKCWICNKKADSGEHKFKASDLKRTYGKKINGIYYRGEPHEINSFKDSFLKFEKVICKNCNESRTRPHDDAYDEFIKYTDSNYEKLFHDKTIDFKDIYGVNWFESKKNLYRYFSKHAGCKLETGELDTNTLTKKLANFINGDSKMDSLVIQFEIKPFVKEYVTQFNKINRYTHLFNGSTLFFGESFEQINYGGWLSKNWITTNWIVGNFKNSQIINKQIENLIVKKDYSKSFETCKDFNELITYLEYGDMSTINSQIKHFKSILKINTGNT